MSFVWMCVLTLGILQASVFFTTIYLHRSLAHRGVVLNPLVRFLMHLELALFTGIVPREWVAVHRKHHHFSDREGDPHSPYVYGLWKVLFGNLLYYRKEANNPETIRKYTPDYEPILIDRIPLVRYGVLGGLAIFMALFGWAWGLAAWTFHSLAYILLNSSINSICHMIGYRNFDNLATNLQSVALLTGGEGLHNNHHQHPASAKLSATRWEFDPAWALIRLLEMTRLASVNRATLARAC
ncbi:MAG: fatty acid desaturase [Acidobacteria bacterium]|nr:fatty acid desaturase [Acidobacteriota bacterium]